MFTSLELLSLFYVWVFLSAFFISDMPPASQCHEGLDILAPYKIIGGAASPPPFSFAFVTIKLFFIIDFVL